MQAKIQWHIKPFLHVTWFVQDVEHYFLLSHTNDVDVSELLKVWTKFCYPMDYKPLK